MGQTTNQIEAHIENTRENLGSNLYELENKVKSAFDWKQQFQNNPSLMLGAAFGGGILLASMLGGNRKSRRRGNYYTGQTRSSEPHEGSDRQKHHALETWDNIKGALIGVAAERFKNYVGEIVPGFHEQYEKTDAEAKRPTYQPLRSQQASTM